MHHIFLTKLQEILNSTSYDFPQPAGPIKNAGTSATMFASSLF